MSRQNARSLSGASAPSFYLQRGVSTPITAKPRQDPAGRGAARTAGRFGLRKTPTGGEGVCRSGRS